jgi:lysophospholipase L1-like esterase
MTPSPKTYLALGDSYTIGESVPPAENFPSQLTAALAGSGIALAPPIIIARTGWTTDELAAAIARSETHPPYDLVTLLIGVNNQYRGYPLDDYRAEFASLLQHAIAFAGGDPAHVIVVSIPDWGAVPFASRDPRGPAQISAEVSAFNAASREETEAQGAHYVDIFPASQAAYHDPSLVAADGLHPSGAQYALWVGEILPAAVEILSP